MFIKYNCPFCEAVEGEEHKDYCLIMHENIRRHGLSLEELTYDEAVEIALKDINAK